MTCHSMALDITTAWIRFWFPWVRWFEMESVTDHSWELNGNK